MPCTPIAILLVLAVSTAPQEAPPSATPTPAAPDVEAAPAPVPAPELLHVEDTLRVLRAELALDRLQVAEVRAILRRERTSQLVGDLREQRRAEELLEESDEKLEDDVEVGLDASLLSLLGTGQEPSPEVLGLGQATEVEAVLPTARRSFGFRRGSGAAPEAAALSLLGPRGARVEDPRPAFPEDEIEPVPEHEALRTLRATTLDDILKTLDPQQQDRYRAMLGPGGEEALRQLARQRAQAWQRTGFATAPSGPLTGRAQRDGPRAGSKETAKRGRPPQARRRNNQRRPRPPRPPKQVNGNSGGGGEGGSSGPPPPAGGPKPRGAVPRPGGGHDPVKTGKSRGPG